MFNLMAHSHVQPLLPIPRSNPSQAPREDNLGLHVPLWWDWYHSIMKVGHNVQPQDPGLQAIPQAMKTNVQQKLVTANLYQPGEIPDYIGNPALPLLTLDGSWILYFFQHTSFGNFPTDKHRNVTLGFALTSKVELHDNRTCFDLTILQPKKDIDFTFLFSLSFLFLLTIIDFLFRPINKGKYSYLSLCRTTRVILKSVEKYLSDGTCYGVQVYI